MQHRLLAPLGRDLRGIRQNARLKDLALGYFLGDTDAAFKRRSMSKNKADRFHEEYVRFASTGRHRSG